MLYSSYSHNNIPAFKTESMQSYIRISNRITGTLKIVLGVIAGISLFVGGLGIMNIMLISVKERTKEIGIRKAIGARESDIVYQFLMESVVISLIGGLFGILIGVMGVVVASAIAKAGSLLSAYPVLVAFGSSVLVGTVAGIYPALQAARLDPIQSLKYE